MRKVFWVVGVIIVAVIAWAAVAGNHSGSGSSDSSQSPSPSLQASAQPAADSATITYGANGFEPAQTVVKSGARVTFVNQSSHEIQVDSDPHPVHTDDTDLNVGTIEPGQSKTATLTKKGTFGLHNHLDPSQTAQITIE